MDEERVPETYLMNLYILSVPFALSLDIVIYSV